MLGQPFQPYLGAGFGADLIDHAQNEFAVSATAGIRFMVTDEFYVGARYRFYYVNNPTDDFGTRYNAVTMHTFSAVLGVYLN